MNRQQRKHAVYTTSQVRKLDRIAIEQFGIAGYLLMTRAAQATFDHINRKWPEIRSVCVVCGSGNNAGDGYVFARLAHEAGWQVNVLTLINTQKLSGDAQTAYLDYLSTDNEVITYEPGQSLPDCELIIDALLGTGLKRDVSGVFQSAIEQINQHPAYVMSMDIPSGLQADTGQTCGCAVFADLTVTFIAMKQGLLTGQAREYTGELQLADLDIPNQIFAQITTNQHIITHDDLKAALKPRQRTAHKGNHGHSLLIGGTEGMSGAIQLAGTAALRSGSGLVSIATHPSHAAWLNLHRPELMVHAVESVQQLRPLLDKKTVLGIGPGLGKDLWAQQLLLLALDAELPLMIDADALNLLADMNHKYDHWVLTPHPAEAARLLVCSTADIEADRVKAVRTLQQRFGGVCVLKGAGTLIASKYGVAYCTAGNPGMATGGTGDVLTGIITALIAQGLDNITAAQMGVQVHATAADQAAIQQGERGLLASDIIDQLQSRVNP